MIETDIFMYLLKLILELHKHHAYYIYIFSLCDLDR